MTLGNKKLNCENIFDCIFIFFEFSIIVFAIVIEWKTTNKQTMRQTTETLIDMTHDRFSPELSLDRRHCRTGKPSAARLRLLSSSVSERSPFCCSYHNKQYFFLCLFPAGEHEQQLARSQPLRLALIPKRRRKLRWEIVHKTDEKFCNLKRNFLQGHKKPNEVKVFPTTVTWFLSNLLAFWSIIAHC